MISILRSALFSLSVTGLQSWTFKEQNPSLTDQISMMEKWQVTAPMAGTWFHHGGGGVRVYVTILFCPILQYL